MIEAVEARIFACNRLATIAIAIAIAVAVCGAAIGCSHHAIDSSSTAQHHEPAASLADSNSTDEGSVRASAEREGPMDSSEMRSLPKNATNTLKSPSENEPVVFAAGIDRNSVSPGDKLWLVIQSSTFADWHINAAKNAGASAQPTRINLELPSALIHESTWNLPEPRMVMAAMHPVMVYSGVNLYSTSLRVADDAQAGEYEIVCEIAYQACDHLRCLPPTTTKVTVPLTVSKRE